MGEKLTNAQRELLRLLASGPRYDITVESTVKALARRGLAERFTEKMGYMSSRHAWRLTAAGRAALSSPSAPMGRASE